ncbi:phosphoglucomutase/phosphomannomutase family protein, partial [Myxococcota bacterium]|nr:phosphoglucomutase/phosphomannomutase family protein [Myxococcota bacterium]
SLAVERHPIGFKYLSGALLAGRAEVAGEESGGFAWSRMGPDKDGILAGALLVELVARSGRPLESHVDRLEACFGPSACGRVALAARTAYDRALAGLEQAPPTRIDRQAIRDVDTRSGLRFALADGGFVMFRRSGTEAVLRIYAEAGDAQRLDQRLRAGLRLLARAGR